MKSGIVTFAGAGPGAPDLLTLRAQRAITEADIIVHAGSLVNPEVLRDAKPGCKLYDSASMALPEIMSVMIEGARAGKKVLRLHTGDPSVFGAIAEQMRELDKAKIQYEVIPGVSSVFAASAALNVELTLPGVSQTVILCRLAGKTPVPESQSLEKLAAAQATMAIFLSVQDIAKVIEELIRGGYSKTTPAAIVARASWPDEKIICGTLGDIAYKVKHNSVWRQAMILVGPALSGAGEYSKLYAPEFAHGFRGPSEKEKPATEPLIPLNEEAFYGKVALYAVSKTGLESAKKLQASLPADIFLPEKIAGGIVNAKTFPEHGFKTAVQKNWKNYDAHVFLMSAGIAARTIAPLLSEKTSDPAVVVCDEQLHFAVSLVGGHIAGANRLARQLAALSGATPVVTTASDTANLLAFDELASRFGWEIENPKDIKLLNALQISGEPLGLFIPQEIYSAAYGNKTNSKLLEQNDLKNPAKWFAKHFKGLVVLDGETPKIKGLPVLKMRRGKIVLGVGSRKGVPAEEIEKSVARAMRRAAIEEIQIIGIATAEVKRSEGEIEKFAHSKGWTIKYYSVEELAKVSTPTPSSTVKKKVGTPSVSEAAALLLGGGKLILPKQIIGKVTVSAATFRKTISRGAAEGAERPKKSD